MPRLEDAAILNHTYSDDCPGTIISNETGLLVCSECAAMVGKVDTGLLDQMIDLLSQLPDRAAR